MILADGTVVRDPSNTLGAAPVTAAPALQNGLSYEEIGPFETEADFLGFLNAGGLAQWAATDAAYSAYMVEQTKEDIAAQAAYQAQIVANVGSGA